MSLPKDFNEIENLTDIVRLEHNKKVKLWFKKQDDDDVSTPKARLKHSCLIKDDDSIPTAIMRLWLFEFTVGHTQSLQPVLMLAPDRDKVVSMRYKPQIQLFFEENSSASTYDPEYKPVTGEISFRLMDETSETITRAKAEKLALTIKNIFGKPLFIWEKGWFYSTYYDLEKGYRLKVLAKSKIEGQRVIKEILQIQSHTFDKNFYKFNDHEKSFPSVPPTKKIYGKNRKLDRIRPRADVKFKNAKLLLDGLKNPINLVDASGFLRNPIERI